jgi:hypothetical protein
LNQKSTQNGVQSRYLGGLGETSALIAIHQHIWSDKQSGGNLLQQLYRKDKAYQTYRNGRQAGINLFPPARMAKAMLLNHGARTVVNWCDKKDDSLSQWLQRLKQRQHVCKVTVALAKKKVRMVFVVMSRIQALDMDKSCEMAA